jgi:FtsH-binding integral membrane protein
MRCCLGETLPISRNSVTSHCPVVLIVASLSGYTLLNVLLANTQSEHLHSFCATVLSSGLATSVILTRVAGDGCRTVYYMGVDLLLVSFL